MATTTNTKGGTAATTKAATAYKASALPTTATQYRNASGGTGTPQANAYKAACRGLAKWAKANGQAAQVHALVHLGWCAGAGARANCQSSNSVAYKAAAHLLQVGQPAAPQVCATLATLAKAGAPAPMLATVWATYTGQAATA